MAIPDASLSPVERFELVVSEEGILPIPEGLRGTLHLEPGEIVALERGSGSLHLETFSAFLGVLEQSVPIEEQWGQVVERFLSRALTALDTGMKAAIMRHDPALPAQVVGLSPEILAYVIFLVTLVIAEPCNLFLPPARSDTMLCVSISS